MHLRVRFSGGQGRRPGTSLSAQTDSVFCRSTDRGILEGISLWSELSEVSRPDRVVISSALTVCSCSKSKINLQLNAPTTIDTSWKSGDHTRFSSTSTTAVAITSRLLKIKVCHCVWSTCQTSHTGSILKHPWSSWSSHRTAAVGLPACRRRGPGVSPGEAWEHRVSWCVVPVFPCIFWLSCLNLVFSVLYFLFLFSCLSLSHEFNLCLVVGPALDCSLSLSHPGCVTYVVMSVAV